MGPVKAAVEESPAVPVSSTAGERRHLTILFCDLVGSTTIAAQLDPEEWRATVASYQHAASDAIKRFEGEVVRYVGDGIMAFFGYPVAHDNDGERAARAGLAILDAVTQLNQGYASTKLSLRIGIDSGPVVVGVGAGQTVDAFGDAANIAARVQAMAEPDTVLVTGSTQRLIAGLFELEDRGEHQLKGIERPMRLYRAIRPSGMRGRFEAAAAAGGLTPFVGREDELRSLLSRWERAREGEGQVVTLIGEAGIGKSRLLRRFQQVIAATPHTWIEAGAGAFFQNTPFYAITEMLRQILGDAPDPIALLEERLDAVGLKAADAIPLLAPILNLPPSDKYPPSTLAPEQQRRRLLATLVEWVLGSARTQPLVIAIEDLHWADPSTLELIQLLVEQGTTAPLLLLYTARPEFHPLWPLRAHHAQLNLNRLSARDVRTMVSQVAASKALSDETVATVVERTGGVPLFVEELTRAVLESGDATLTGRVIPVTLHDSLMARLDRLGPAKEVLQIGAVLGSDFSYALLHAVHPITDADLQQLLHTLTDAELLYVRGIAPEATYQFKHALIRDAAYDALLKSRRKELHGVIARTIDEQFPPIKESHPEVLARHYQRADEAHQALGYLQLAGEQAMQHSSNREAATCFGDALQILQGLPEGTERERQELELLLKLGPAQMMLKGFGAVESEKAYQRARDLCAKLGESPQLYTVLWGQWMFLSIQAKWEEASTIAQDLLTIADSVGDEVLQLEAHHASWNTFQRLGDLAQAEQHILKGFRLYSPNRHRFLASQYGGHDPGVCCFSHAGINRWLLGQPNQALVMIHESLRLAHTLGHRYSIARAFDAATMVQQLRREAYGTSEQAAAMVRLSEQEGFPYWRCHANVFLGWALSEQGRSEEGVALMRQALAEYREIGSVQHYSYFLVLLAEELGYCDQIDEALTLLAQAAQMLKSGERWCEADIYRVTAELLLKQSRANGLIAEEKLRTSIAVCQRQGAKSFELRATTSLARLLSQQNKRGEARAMLAEIYGWFTEGFDTPDLKEAKALLDELNG